MTPVTAACRLLCSVLLGGVLGIFYGFLRPPGRNHPHLRDLVFMTGAAWVWLYIGFAICRGDIRPIYLLGMVAGLVLWEISVGKWLRPVFAGFWRGIGWVLAFILLPWKKFLDFSKILFASAEKWVTIECMKILNSRKKRRKETHGTEKHPAQESESGNSSCIQYP